MGGRPPPAGGDARGRGLKVRLLCVGKDRSGLFSPGVAEYAQRLSHYAHFSLVELPESRGRGAGVAAQAEAKVILAARSARDWLVALDEHGQAMSSVELSRFVGTAQQQAKDLLFVIGGDEGLGDEVRSAARLTLSLSKMTLPHRLARLVLSEQLYRAFTLLRGEPYHK